MIDGHRPDLCEAARPALPAPAMGNFSIQVTIASRSSSRVDQRCSSRTFFRSRPKDDAMAVSSPQTPTCRPHQFVVGESVHDLWGPKLTNPIRVDHVAGHRAVTSDRAAQCRDRQEDHHGTVDGAADEPPVGAVVLHRAQGELALVSALLGQIGRIGQPRPVGAVAVKFRSIRPSCTGGPGLRFSPRFWA